MLKDQSDSGAIAIILQNFGDMLIFGNNNPSLTRPHGKMRKQSV